MARVDADDIPFNGTPRRPDALTREFTEIGEQRYRMVVQPAGITFMADRVRRERHELVAELAVTVNINNFPSALTSGSEGLLSIGDLNFSAVTSRAGRGRLLKERAGMEMDWYGLLEDFAQRIFAAERRGKPPVELATVELDERDDSATWEVEGFPLLQHLPSIIFGDSSSGKSMFAMWLAGMLAREHGIDVVYADWEFSPGEHRRRLGLLFQPMPRIWYVRCERSLKDEADRIARIIAEKKARYLIADSIGFACDGPAESQEAAGNYFRALRSLGVGSLSIAHIPKSTEEGKDAQIYGSVFFKHGARSVWFIEKANENPPGQLRFGLHHRKNNVGERLAPRAYAMTFEKGRTLINKIKADDVDEIAARLPLLDRIKKLLIERQDLMSVKDLAEELSSTQPVVRTTLARHKSQFRKVGTKYGLTVATAPEGGFAF